MSDVTVQGVMDQMSRVSKELNQQPGVKVRFFYEGTPDEEASKVQGRPISRLVEKIEIKIESAGREVVRNCTQEHISQFPELYRAFKSQEEKPDDGTLLKDWSLIPQNVMCEIRDLGIRTVEELAVCTGISGSIQHYAHWVQCAKDWIDGAKDAKNLVPGLKKEIEKLTKLNDKHKEHIALLERKLAGE